MRITIDRYPIDTKQELNASSLGNYGRTMFGNFRSMTSTDTSNLMTHVANSRITIYSIMFRDSGEVSEAGILDWGHFLRLGMSLQQPSQFFTIKSKMRGSDGRKLSVAG